MAKFREYLCELSPSLMKRYVEKASEDKARAVQKYNNQTPHSPEQKETDKYIFKRFKNINRANRKIRNKEEPDTTPKQQYYDFHDKSKHTKYRV
jgi:hypothetical protein